MSCSKGIYVDLSVFVVAFGDRILPFKAVIVIITFLRFIFSSLQTMRVCCQDMFFSRSRSTPSGHQLLNIPASRDQSRMLGTPLEHMFKRAQKQSQKLNAVKELLDVKIKDPIEQDFSNEV